MPLVRRVRQHVNPLSDKYAQPAVPPDWQSVYERPQQPLHLDIGCGKGYFLRDMAAVCPDWNFLGLEIRQPLVEQALRWRDRQRLKNLHFIFGNANNSLRPLLESWGEALQLQRVSIQFPDPWFKKRHQKRRVVQPQLVEELAQFMPQTGWVWLQSDIEAVAQEMCDRFGEHPGFERQGDDWLAETLLPAQTDREQVTLAQGKPVYRALFIRNELSV
ncbi:MAG: tRNA (guanosine(46)-N7)-methyltransferase TrmB [Leptolyngbya sp. SIO4C1]|nr:tRNA (guanosine(46)-N7)-methyltransferase TrmB [Leptolyngbya sp. SIO4C1]